MRAKTIIPPHTQISLTVSVGILVNRRTIDIKLPILVIKFNSNQILYHTETMLQLLLIEKWKEILNQDCELRLNVVNYTKVISIVFDVLWPPVCFVVVC